MPSLLSNQITEKTSHILAHGQCIHTGIRENAVLLHWNAFMLCSYARARQVCCLTYVQFLQRVSIACYAERCISYDRFCLTV